MRLRRFIDFFVAEDVVHVHVHVHAHVTCADMCMCMYLALTFTPLRRARAGAPSGSARATRPARTARRTSGALRGRVLRVLRAPCWHTSQMKLPFTLFITHGTSAAREAG